MEIRTGWCSRTNSAWFVTDCGRTDRYAFCHAGLDEWIIPPGVRVRLVLSSVEVEGAACGTPAARYASMYITERVRAQGWSTWSRLWWWPEIEEEGK
jgi:hypothetical protein